MRRALVALALVAGVLAGCGGASEQEQLVDQLESDFDMGAEQAECVADQLYERFSAEEIDALREVDDRDDLTDDQLADLRAALTPCASAGS
ncbi:MAG TPA: hypothetical protein VF228_17835 [Iamia sp.]